MMKLIATAKDLARSRDANDGFEKKTRRQRPLVATKRSGFARKSILGAALVAFIVGAAATIAWTGGVDPASTFELQEQARDATTVCEMCTGNGNDEFCLSMFDGPHGCYYIEGFCNEQEICDQAAADGFGCVWEPEYENEPHGRHQCRPWDAFSTNEDKIEPSDGIVIAAKTVEGAAAEQGHRPGGTVATNGPRSAPQDLCTF